MKLILRVFCVITALLIIQFSVARAHWPDQSPHRIADLGEFQFEGGGLNKNLRMPQR